MRPRDRGLAHQLESNLQLYRERIQELPGIRSSGRKRVLIEQLLESIHRVDYVSVIRAQMLSGRREDPSDELFDPLKAAILRQRAGDVDEAFWLIFIFVHFGKNPRGGWRFAREIYGRLGDGKRWDWAKTSKDPSAFRKWLGANQKLLKRKGVAGGFGNHRKYESLDAYSENGTGAVVESYVKWVGAARSHKQLMDSVCDQADGNRRKAFDALYQSMNAVKRFGRTARLDYLAMLGKLELAPIEPASAYIKGATGPLSGARLLFGGDKTAQLSPATLDKWLLDLDSVLSVGMQVLEDALCNWQKSPDKFKRFRG